MPISDESTTGERDITADQENLGPSEELRLAELERQQSINSPTSCRENLKKMELELMKVKEEMKNAKLEHENKALRAELAHQKLRNAHMTLQTKMEEYQNKQQQNFDDLTKKLKEDSCHVENWPNPSKSMGFHGMSPDSRSLSSID
ncbi:hypothetical protein GPALN_013467 [Globodera pallida]|nr:hypothetical protein GPALN_013467 [Globodera pallida]